MYEYQEEKEIESEKSSQEYTPGARINKQINKTIIQEKYQCYIFFLFCILYIELTYWWHREVVSEIFPFILHDKCTRKK